MWGAAEALEAEIQPSLCTQCHPPTHQAPVMELMGSVTFPGPETPSPSSHPHLPDQETPAARCSSFYKTKTGRIAPPGTWPLVLQPSRLSQGSIDLSYLSGKKGREKEKIPVSGSVDCPIPHHTPFPHSPCKLHFFLVLECVLLCVNSRPVHMPSFYREHPTPSCLIPRPLTPTPLSHLTRDGPSWVPNVS